jgi:trehalose 6-phosphate phosphatase
VNELFSHWEDVRRALPRADHVLWLFDFDGTLAPIVKHPLEAAMPPDLRRLLRQLAQRHPGRVGVLTGRALGPLRKLVGLPELIYGGTHGFEIEGPDFRWRHPVSSVQQKRLHQMARLWRRELTGLRGLWMENKKWSLCVHYRQARAIDKGRVRSVLHTICSQARHLGFKVLDGLKTVEIFSTARWNKGQAVRWLRRHCRVEGVFYVGDDATDETVFRVLGRSDGAVRIGKSNASRAAYYLQRQSQIKKLLKRILTL